MAAVRTESALREGMAALVRPCERREGSPVDRIVQQLEHIRRQGVEIGLGVLLIRRELRLECSHGVVVGLGAVVGLADVGEEVVVRDILHAVEINRRRQRRRGHQ